MPLRLCLRRHHGQDESGEGLWHIVLANTEIMLPGQLEGTQVAFTGGELEGLPEGPAALRFLLGHWLRCFANLRTLRLMMKCPVRGTCLPYPFRGTPF